MRFFDDCVRMQGTSNLGFGYAPLIRAYVDYLKAKIEFHRVHPEFTGNFDYEEYLSLKGVADLNEGYQTIMELMDLQGRLEGFEKQVFESTHGITHSGECRVASLVPLIEESHGIYKFLTSMLSAMHLAVESAEPLMPLVERYNQLFMDLKRFYQAAQRIPYVTSVMNVPELPNEPPSFADIVVNRVAPKVVAPLPSPPPVLSESSEEEEEPLEDLLGDALLDDGKQKGALEQLRGLQYGTHTNTVQTVAVPVIDPRLQEAVERLEAENAQLRGQLAAAAAHIAGLEEALRQEQQLRTDLQRQYDLREQRHQEQIRALEDHLRMVRSEVDTWRARHDGMGQLYQKLREEHLALLSGSTDRDREEAERLRKLEEEERLRKLEEERKRLEEEERLRQLDEERKRLEEEERKRLAEEEARLQNPSDELERLAETVDEAAERFKDVAADLGRHISFPSGLHAAILAGTEAMTGALAALIRHAIAAQREIVAEGKDSDLSPEEFYRKNSQWANGLISAAQAVATATVLLVETANGVLLGGGQSLEQLVVAMGTVAAATAQLVTASRVKAVRRSVAQPLLEDAARAVSEANKALVAAVESNAAEESSANAALNVPEAISLPGLTVMEHNKHAEMQRVETKLTAARSQLAEMRRSKYATDSSQSGPIDVEEMNKQVEIKELEKSLSTLKLEYSLLQLKKPEAQGSTPDSVVDAFDLIDGEQLGEGSLFS